MSAAEQPPLRLQLVGEGDFTLALSLATQLKHVAITATGIDTHADLIKKYRDAPATLRRLQAAGAIAKHGVDACALQGSYDEVHFGHPHLGVENAAAHHRLLAHYFHSAKQVAPVVRVTWRFVDTRTPRTSRHQLGLGSGVPCVPGGMGAAQRLMTWWTRGLRLA